MLDKLRPSPDVFILGEAVEDWKIIQMLSEELHTTLPYETIQSVRHREIGNQKVQQCFNSAPKYCYAARASMNYSFFLILKQ